MNWTQLEFADSIYAIFHSHPLYFHTFALFLSYVHTQIGYLDVVIPPDFIAEDTSSDVIVPEGSSVKLTCRFVAFFINFILLFPP